MTEDVIMEGPPEAFKALVKGVLEGPVPVGVEFDAARTILSEDPSHPSSFNALCVLLEGALADPTFPVEETQALVPLLKALARGTLGVRDLL